MARFDEFAAFMVNEPSLAAAIDAGMGDSLPPGLVDVTSALLGAIAAAVRVNDTDAIRRIGTDFGALASALHQATRGGGETSERAAAPTMRKVGRNYWLAPGHEPVRVRKRAHVKAVEVDGEDVPIGKAKIAGSKFVRRRVRKG